MEYTLEDTYEDLKELQEQLNKEIEDLAISIQNNRFLSLNEAFDSESIKERQYNMAVEIMERIPRNLPSEYPIPKTTDMYIDALNDLEKEIHNAQNHLDKTQEQLQSIEKNIAHLESKKNGFDKMREMYFTSVQTLEDKTYDNELSMAKRLFQDVKENLHHVIEILFPENEHFKDLLVALTTAYDKGGDDVYVDVISATLDCVKYLIEADIVVYHPSDKSKIKMADLL